MLDYSVLTHTKGKKADFSDTIIIMTSNLGENEQNGIGFGECSEICVSNTPVAQDCILREL